MAGAHGAVVHGALADADVSVTVATLADSGGDDAVVGFVSWRSHAGSPAMSSYGEVEAIAVDPAHRRRGIGRRLLDHAVVELRASGVPVIMLATGGDSGHAPARALYEATGFTRLPTAQYWLAANEAAVADRSEP